ncbi:MAG: hypothetical protein AAFX76_02065 [Planctomycetota bacterium]
MSKPATPLRELVEGAIDRQWIVWSRDHPHLARAIDRTRLIDTTAERLAEDPDFRAAMHDADLDERRLVEAARLLAWAEGWIKRALR